MEVCSIKVLNIQVIVRGIDPSHTCEFKICAFVKPDKSRPTVGIPTEVLADPPHVALTIDSSRTSNREVMNFLEIHKLANFLLPLAVDRVGPSVVSLGRFDCAIDRDRQICDICGPDREHVESTVRWNENLSVSCCEVRLHYCIHERLLVDLLCDEGVII